MYVIRWCIFEVIIFFKIIIGSCKFMQNAFFCKYIRAHGFDWFTRYIMSIIVSNCQYCTEQQFQTLSCVHFTIFSVVKLDLFIRGLLLGRILAVEKTTRTLAYILLLKALKYLLWMDGTFHCCSKLFYNLCVNVVAAVCSMKLPRVIGICTLTIMNMQYSVR